MGLIEEANILSGESLESNFLVWEENWVAFEIFNDVSDQWSFAGIGSIIGLNGAFVLDYIRESGFNGKYATSIYKDVRDIASGAIEAFNEKRNKNA